MANFKTYKRGEKIRGIAYLEDTGYVYHKNFKYREAKFLCPICGSDFTAMVNSIKMGNTESCGCKRVDRTRNLRMTHGNTHTLTFKTWMCMRERCRKKVGKIAKTYYHRGITVCKEWNESFESFLKDMGERPSPEHTIDRVDNYKGYCKDNCRWATAKEQSRNRRDTIYLEYKGVKRPFVELLELSGLKKRREVVADRLARGWSIDRAFENKIAELV